MLGSILLEAYSMISQVAIPHRFYKASHRRQGTQPSLFYLRYATEIDTFTLTTWETLNDNKSTRPHANSISRYRTSSNLHTPQLSLVGTRRDSASAL